MKEEKGIIRKQMLSKRFMYKNIVRKKSVSCIFDNLSKLSIFSKSKNILIYYPFRGEIDLRGFFSGHRLFMPKVINRDIFAVPFFDGVLFEKNRFGICEPVGDVIFDKNILDIVIVPCLAVDRDFNRLGFGGGFYDRFLVDFMGSSVCIVFDFQVFEKLPHEKHDINVDFIVSESYNFSRCK